jgi:hypothetical protein
MRCPRLDEAKLLIAVVPDVDRGDHVPTSPASLVQGDRRGEKVSRRSRP